MDGLYKECCLEISYTTIKGGEHKQQTGNNKILIVKPTAWLEDT